MGRGGRWSKMGDEMLRMQDRHERDFCLGLPMKSSQIFFVEVQSYKRQPVNFYQIQTKFQNERRLRLV